MTRNEHFLMKYRKAVSCRGHKSQDDYSRVLGTNNNIVNCRTVHLSYVLVSVILGVA